MTVLFKPTVKQIIARRYLSLSKRLVNFMLKIHCLIAGIS